jgi:tRNA A-37 threonylcarbamoyl transferase component Bud32
MKNVVAKDIADELHLDVDIIYENILEVIKEERQKSPKKYFVLDEKSKQAYVFEEEDVSYITNSEKNEVSFLELASYFKTKTTSLSWFLNELLKQDAISQATIDYLQTVKNKPEIRAVFEPEEVNVNDDFFLVLNINTEVEILEPEITLNTPQEIDVLFKPSTPNSYTQGRHMSRYQLRSIKHGKTKLDMYFKGIIEGKIYSDRINVPELRIKSLPPDIYAEKIPRSETLYGEYNENTETVLRITNRGIGEAYNVRLEGFPSDVRVISGDIVGRIGVKARIDHPVTLRPTKSGDVTLGELKMIYEDGDGNNYSFSLPEIVFKVVTPQPELKIEVDSRKTVNRDEIFPVGIRVTNLGKGEANQVNVTARINPLSSLLSGSLFNYFRRINPGESMQISFELRAPDKGNLSLGFESIEYRDPEGKTLNDVFPPQVINVRESGVVIEGERDWPFEVGARIDKYEIKEVLGEGGFAIVYLASDTLMRTDRAMKALKPEYVENAIFVENFINEARTAQKLRNRNIIQVFDVAGYEYKNKVFPYIIMEAVLGGTLRDRMTPGHPLTTIDAVFVGRDICDALSEAHQKNMIHQDIKPSNIFFDDQMVLWKLGDFGLARIVQEEEIISSEGTLSYMAPEKNKTHKSDIYSLGLVLREVLTGTRRGNIQDIRKTSELSESRTGKLIELIERMTDSKPSKRPNLVEVIEVLDTSTVMGGTVR